MRAYYQATAPAPCSLQGLRENTLRPTGRERASSTGLRRQLRAGRAMGTRRRAGLRITCCWSTCQGSSTAKASSEGAQGLAKPRGVARYSDYDPKC